MCSVKQIIVSIAPKILFALTKFGKQERARWYLREIFDMVDWAARARAGNQMKGALCSTIFKLEFDLFASMKKQRQMKN